MNALWKRLRVGWKRIVPGFLDSPRARQNPYPFYKELRDLAPVHCLEKPDVWAVSRYEDARHVLSDSQAYLSSNLPGIEESLLNADGPGHARVRKIVLRAFTASHLKSLEGYVRELAREYVDRMAAGRQCEFMADLAIPLPAKVMAVLLGVDPERWTDYSRWAEPIVVEDTSGSDPATTARFQACLRERDAFVADHIEQCRKGRKQDVFSKEVIADLTDVEATDVLKLLLVAGYVTTTNLLGNLAVVLMRNPDVEASLRADPRLIPAAIEETLRLNSPVLSAARRAAQDVTLAGQPIPEKARLLILLGAANRTEESFPDPDRFVLNRKPPGHLAFGAGAHFCLGAPLARLEARVVFETLLARLQHIEAAEPLDQIEWVDSNRHMRGPKRLRLNVRAFSST